MAISKPASVAASAFKSAKWDEITDGRDFAQSDAPQIALLCQWYEVIERCMDDISDDSGVHVAYQNDMGDIKAFPQLATMKQASAEIRALNKQLGINDEARAEASQDVKETTLYVIQTGRMSRAANRRGAAVARPA